MSSTDANTEPPRFPGLEAQRVPNLPPAAYYVPNFITPEEEEYLLRKIEATPQPKWRTVGSGRRLQYWGGTTSKSNVLLPEPMPDFLTGFPEIIERIDAFLDAAADVPANERGKGKGALGINQVLINEYQPGQGISPHEDGGAFRPLVATLSLGSHTVLDLHHYVSPTAPSPPMIASEEGDPGGRVIAAVPLGHVLLMPRSLFILTGTLYTDHLHGIVGRDGDTVVAGLDAEGEQRKTDEGQATDVDLAPNTDPTTTTQASTTPGASAPVTVANAALLDNPAVEGAIADGGWTAARGTRVSFTFRHANKVLKGGRFALGAGGIRRG